MNTIPVATIVDILLPHMGDRKGRKALIELALSGCGVLNHIDWEGPAIDFTKALVGVLLRFERCNDQPAIVSVLKALKNHVGNDVQGRIDEVIGQIMPVAQHTHPAPGVWPAQKSWNDLHVYVACASPDRQVAERVEAFLKREGIAVFRDKSEPGNGAGEDWTIQSELRKASHMVLLLSRASMSFHANVYHEWSFFEEHNKPIITLYLEDCDLHSRILKYNRIDLRGDLEEGLRRLLAELGPEISRGRPIEKPRERTDRTGTRQVWVPSGSFQMGSDRQIDPDAEDDELPRHEVYITRGFWLDVHPVTNAAYQQFVADGGYRRADLWAQKGWEWLRAERILGPKVIRHFDEPPQPRVGVSWFEADAYARWRGGRLPTEAEWEYASRGPASLVYPWGKQQAEGLNINRRWRITTAVATYARDKSWVGAYDMAGNVMEWVADWYRPDYYDERVSRDPPGPADGLTRVLRGGSWSSKPAMARAANRHSCNPQFSDNYISFRVVCDRD